MPQRQLRARQRNSQWIVDLMHNARRKPSESDKRSLGGDCRRALQVGAAGNIRSRTLKAFPENAYREVISSLG